MKAAQEWEALGKRILGEIRDELYIMVRVMGPALDALGTVMDRRTRTMGTDTVDIRFNPAYVSELFLNRPRSLLRCYMHILLHCLFRHPFTREKAADPELYDLCADIAAESLLDSMGEPGLAEMPSEFRETWLAKLKQEAGVLSAEVLYRFFTENPPDWETRLKLTEEFRRDDHSFWDQPEDPDRQGTPPPRSLREEDWKNRAKSTRELMAASGPEASGERGSLSWMLAVSGTGKTAYRDYLRRFTTVREEVRVDPDGFDYAWYHYGMELYGNMPLVEENEYRETVGVDELVIAIDTSASTRPVLVQHFLEETAAILGEGETFLHHVEIHLIECDSSVQRDLRIHDVKALERLSGNFEIRGGMGTDFRPVFSYVEELRRKGELKNLRGMLYFTDGYGIYPEEAPPWETAFVFCEDAAYDDTKVPDWAVRLYAGGMDGETRPVRTEEKSGEGL